MKASIYALKDPNTGEIMYIGKTIDAKRREKEHLTEGSNRAKLSWVNSLKENGQSPIFEIIEECEMEEWKDRETYHILNEKEKNELLLNVRIDGECSSVKPKSDNIVRFNFFLDEEVRNLLESEKSNYGFSSVSGFIRFIIIKFFEKK